MSYIRRLGNGDWSATARLPDGRRCSTTRTSQQDARAWADHIEAAAARITATVPDATFTWTPTGLTIHIPDEHLTMDNVVQFEQALARILGGS